MVQEVQTGIWITNETTLETIQAIGTSSVKIVEWRQTRWGRYYYSCEADWQDSQAAPATEVTPISITSSYGNTEFKEVDDGIRIPQAWWYEITMRCKGWNIGSWINIKHSLRANGTEIFSITTTNNNDTKTDTVTVNLWKFDILKIVSIWTWTEWYWAVSYNTIKITKL